MTSSGIIMVDRINSMTRPAPRNRLRARPYAANALTANWRVSPTASTISELSRPRPSPKRHAVWKLYSDTPCGNRYTWPSLGSPPLNAVTTIDHSGTTKIPITITYSTSRIASRPPRRAVHFRGSRNPSAVELLIRPPGGCATRAAGR